MGGRAGAAWWRGVMLGNGRGGWWTWRRPPLPRLGTQYHGRFGVSRPSSEWGRVGHPRYRPPGRRTTPFARTPPVGRGRGGAVAGQVLAWAVGPWSGDAVVAGGGRGR